MPDVPDPEWFTYVGSVCSLVGNRRYGLYDDELARDLIQISRDARRFADEVGDRYVGGFPITAEAMKAMLEKNGWTVTRGGEG